MSNFSGVCKPGKAQWESVRIFWGNDSEKDFNKINPFPEIRVPSPKDDPSVVEFNREVNVSPYEPSKMYNSGLKSMDTLFQEMDFDFDEVFKKSSKVTEEFVFIDKDELKKPDNYIENVTKARVQEIRNTGNKLAKKRKAVIANAISQFVIVKIEMTTPVLSVSDLPDLTTWAFLQPPTIGKNKHRISVNNGYVVDDAQKAGWFKAQLDTTNAQEQTSGMWRAEVQVERYQLDETSERKQDYTVINQASPAWIKVDKDDPKTIYIKYEVVVRNDCTLIDLQERKAALGNAGLNKDMVTAECGSYLKVWVRNTNHNWSKDPVDEFSEALREAMVDDDESYDPANPQKFKNHTWRRSPLISGKNKSDLLYVGLYPSTIINRLESLETMMAVQPKLDEDSVNYGAWLSITAIFTLFCYALNKATENSGIEAHTKSDKSKSQEHYIQEKGAMVRKVLDLFSIEEFAAALAAVGLPTSEKNLSSILDDCEKSAYKSTFEFTVYIFKQMLDFALVKDEKSEADHSEKMDKANKEIEARHKEYDVSEGVSKLKNILSQKTVDKKTFKDILKDVKDNAKLDAKEGAAFTTNLDLGSLGTALKMPFPKGLPLPIPFLQWIIWSTEFLVKSGISLDITAAYEETEKTDTSEASDKISLDLSLNSNSNAKILFSLQSAWTAYIDNIDKQYQVKDTKYGAAEDFYFGQMLQDLAKSAEFNLFVGLSLNSDACLGPKFEYDFAKESDAFDVSLNNAKGSLGMVAPAGAHIGVFHWDYKLASAEIVSVTKNEGTFFNKLTFLKNTWNMPQTVRWGSGDIYRFVLLIEPQKHNQYELGDTIKFALPYAEIDDVKDATADITVIAGAIKSFKGDDLKSVAFKEVINLYEYTHRQVLSTEFRVLSEDDSKVSINKKDGTLISEHISAFIESLADGNDTEISAKMAIEDDERIIQSGEGPIILAPKITRNDAMYDHGSKALIFKFNIANFNDDHLWVRFKEKDVISMFDDELKFKSSFSEATEWNCIKLDRSGKSFILKAPLDDFKDLKDEKDIMFAVYAELALAKGEEYIISKDFDLNTIRITDDILKDIKTDKSTA